MSSENLLKLLALNNLEHLLPQLLSIGVTNFNELAKLEYSDYPNAGVVTIEEFENLSELVSHLREELGQSFQSQHNTITTGTHIDTIPSNIRSNITNHSLRKSNNTPPTRERVYQNLLEDSSEYQESVYSTDKYELSDYTDDNLLSHDGDETDASASYSNLDNTSSELSFTIKKEIDIDLLEPRRVIRQGTSTKNSLLNAYGVPTKNPPASKTTPGSSAKKKLALKTLALKNKSQIVVCVRKRPLSSVEKIKNESDIISSSTKMLAVHENKKKVDLTKYIEEHRFCFDRVFNETETNRCVYNSVISPLVEHVFNGGNATCFAYGQTGSGKTHTMLDSNEGLYILAGHDIFKKIKNLKYNDLQVVVVFYEIYLNDVYDLLNNRKKLHAREKADRNVCIKDIAEVSISSTKDLLSVFEYGNKNRSIGSTGANSDSSRSHAIMQIELRKSASNSPIGTTLGKLSFIDLAGNERGADRGEAQNDPTTRREGSEINKSLLALKECIRSLDLGKTHQPFRQSRLTLVLRDSFIGDSLCCMIATVAPNNSNCEHTLNTLRYADRVKSIKNKSSSPHPLLKSPSNITSSRPTLSNKNLPNSKFTSNPPPSQDDSINETSNSNKNVLRQNYKSHDDNKLLSPKKISKSLTSVGNNTYTSTNTNKNNNASLNFPKVSENTLKPKTHLINKLAANETTQRRQSISHRKHRESSAIADSNLTKVANLSNNILSTGVNSRSQTSEDHLKQKTKLGSRLSPPEISGVRSLSNHAKSSDRKLTGEQDLTGFGIPNDSASYSNFLDSDLTSKSLTLTENINCENNNYRSSNSPDSQNLLTQVDLFTKQHLKHIHFLKKACREEVLSMVMYNTFNTNKSTQQHSFDYSLQKIAENDSDNSLSTTPSSHLIKNDEILSPTSKNFENKYSLNDLFELYQSSSSNDIVVRRRQDGHIFKSLDEAKKQTANEYLLQLDCILEAEMEEIKGMRMELSELLSKFF
ncbi:hypothetical protein BB561_005946 [Smittium simulii]|uniref:Kinesin-like protein n=1 Tax=Smittium simulii TaxID=133385 RepID=A0A2T9Y7D7_9FUNG|nr:hypothetical protein BB561_005946 [Smittium simulii]